MELVRREVGVVYLGKDVVFTLLTNDRFILKTTKKNEKRNDRL